MFDKYQNVISDYKERGFIEIADQENKVGCFLPHHPAVKESVTTPLHIVFCASSRPDGGKSLNDCLHTSPSLTLKLHDTLLKFRTNPVAVIADISKAFHLILLHPDHRKYTKFLWIGDTECTRLLCYQIKVVIFGACCSPFLLQQVLDTHLFSTHLPVCGLDSQFYVDNFFKTYDTAKEAISEKPQDRTNNARYSDASTRLG